MDCRNYKELLDSYLCQELAVETNHQMLNHAEYCPKCRAEMASRRNMRDALRRACFKECLSQTALDRMRAQLHAEAFSLESSQKTNAPNWLEKLFSPRILVPVFSVIVVLAIGISVYLKTSSSQSKASPLSELLLTEAASDHQKCATHFALSTEVAFMPDSAEKYDEVYRGLDLVAKSGASGLTLRSAHVCKPDNRQFAHLVYTRGKNLISLLVTKRDGKSLQTGELTPLGTELAELEESTNGALSIGARQTSKHIVLVISDLPQPENEKLAKTLALPVVEHISRIDRLTAHALNLKHQNIIASMRRREMK
ncbi:MAG TPA: hypothetical protein PLK30_18230 [Blastocatellia bacterium]|nr:hypothetical protein [Blastocatellia bacterium]